MNETLLPYEFELTVKSDKNNSFKIKILIDNNSFLNFKIETINQNNSIDYNDNFSFNNIIEKNKYFLICRNIYDVLIIFKQTLNNINNIKLLEKENEIILIIIIPNPFSPQIEFIFTSNRNISNTSINELSELIKRQNDEIETLKQTIEQLKNIINQQGEKLIYLEKKLEVKEDDKNLKEESLISSNIIKDKNIELQIKKWINPDVNISFILLYRKGENDFSANDFHRNCDNKGPTLVLVETTKGYKFGGYTPLDWESPSTTIYKKDEITFLFSLNNLIKYNKKNDKTSIFVDKNYGPGFGSGCDILLGYPAKNQGEGSNSNYLINHELTNGEKNFYLKEVEVFKVEFN